MKKVLFICSGGGHLNELSQLKPLIDAHESMLVTENTGTAPKLTKTQKYLLHGTRAKLFRYLCIFFINTLLSTWYFIRFRPDVIITTGAHTAVPMCYIASLFRKKIIFIESIARVRSKSLTGRLIEKRCTHILVQWEPMLKIYEKSEYVGPIL